MAPHRSQDYFSLDTSKLQITQLEEYLYFYAPDHPLASQNGMVALHRHIVSAHLKRWLKPSEIVMFINGDRTDTRLENLQVANRAKLIDLNATRSEKVALTCHYCKRVYTESLSHARRRHYCSKECRSAARRKFEISAQELEHLVWAIPTSQIAAILGVSDKAIEKRCKKFNVRKPPPGYWASLSTGDIEPKTERLLEEVKSRSRVIHQAADN